MQHALAAAATTQLDADVTSYRRRLYGLGVVLALSSLLVANWIDGSQLWAPVYLPFAGIAMLVICIAGAEYHLFTDRLDRERHAQTQASRRLEAEAEQRQRGFNRLWQELADSRGEPTVPESVLHELAGLFSADLLGVWVANQTAAGYQLRSLYPVDLATGARLDKIARLSPCFEELRTRRQVLRITDFARQTSPALAWFCEDQGLRGAILCPVLVRHELVGVLGFFYSEEVRVSAKTAEEFQAAANLFLCAL